MRPVRQITWYNRMLRPGIRLLFRLIFRTIARVRINGLENVPSSGAYLIVFNHVSIFDPPFVVSFLPTAPEVLGAVDVWSRPGQDLLATLYGGIAIRRGEVDREAMERSLAVLREGKPLLIAPEGGRSHLPGMRLAKPGIVYLVERTGAAILPVGVVGTTDDFFRKAQYLERPTLEMRVGKPVNLPAGVGVDLAPREARQARADWIMRRIADLLPADYHGVYAREDLAG